MGRPSRIVSGFSARVSQRGFALVVVLWAGVILALVAAAISQTSRTDLRFARSLSQAAAAELAADGAVWTAVHRLVAVGPSGWRADGTVYTWRMGSAELRVRVTDEEGRIDINLARETLLAALFAAAGLEDEAAAVLASEVAAYRDERAERARAATGGILPLGLRTVFAVPEALEQVPGFPPALYRRIYDSVTVYSGRPTPGRQISSPLVAAATGAASLEAGPARRVTLDADEELAESGTALGRPSFSRLVRVEAEALMPGGAHFAREAVVDFGNAAGGAFAVRLWRRGERRLFPDQEPEG